MFQIKPAPHAIDAVSHAEVRDLAGRHGGRLIPHVWRAFHLQGEVDPARLQHAADAVCAHHEALRTLFLRRADGSFGREVLEVAQLRVVHEDWSHRRGDDAAIMQRLREALDTEMPVGTCPMACLLLITLAEQRSVLFLALADTIADAGAIRIALQDLTAHYCGREVPAPLFQLSDYVHSHNTWLTSPHYREQLAKAVAGMQRRIEACGIHAVLRYPGGEQNAFKFGAWFEKPVSDALRAIADESRVGVTTLLTAACAMASAAVRGTAETFFTTSFSNRNPRGADRLIGRLASTLPNFVERIPGESLRDCAVRMHRDIFYATAIGGPIPIQDFVDEIELHNPGLPDGAQIRFGQTLIDTTIIEEFDVLGLPSRAIALEETRPTTNDFKFVCRYLPASGISISLRGRRFGDNETQAQRILAQIERMFVEAREGRGNPAPLPDMALTDPGQGR